MARNPRVRDIPDIPGWKEVTEAVNEILRLSEPTELRIMPADEPNYWRPANLLGSHELIDWRDHELIDWRDRDFRNRRSAMAWMAEKCKERGLK